MTTKKTEGNTLNTCKQRVKSLHEQAQNPQQPEDWEKEFDKEFKENLSSDNPWKYAHPYLKDFIRTQISQAKEEARREERQRIVSALFKEGKTYQVWLEGHELKVLDYDQISQSIKEIK